MAKRYSGIFLLTVFIVLFDCPLSRHISTNPRSRRPKLSSKQEYWKEGYEGSVNLYAIAIIPIEQRAQHLPFRGKLKILRRTEDRSIKELAHVHGK